MIKKAYHLPYKSTYTIQVPSDVQDLKLRALYFQSCEYYYGLAVMKPPVWSHLCMPIEANIPVYKCLQRDY